MIRQLKNMVYKNEGKMEERNRCIQSIRKNMEWFGFNMDDFSDDEIIEGTLAFKRVVKGSGFTVKEMHESLLILGTSGGRIGG